MPSLETICRQFFHGKPWAAKILLGGALLIVPVVNFVALGYLFRMAYSLRHGETDAGELPEWDDWKNLFILGLRFIGVFLLFGGVPILLGLIGSWLFFQIISGIFGGWFVWIAMLPLSVALFIAVPLSAAALYRFMGTMSFRSLWPADSVINLLLATKARLLLPTFSLIGFCYVLTPILPFAVFLGFALILQYYMLIFRYTEYHQQESSSHE